MEKEVAMLSGLFIAALITKHNRSAPNDQDVKRYGDLAEAVVKDMVTRARRLRDIKKEFEQAKYPETRR